MRPSKAERWIFACERCNEIASITVEMISDEVREARPGSGNRICQPALCPKCSGGFDETAALTSQAPLEFYDPPTERTNVVLVDPFTLRQAQAHIVQCEYCSDEAEITFDYILDAITGCDPTITQYVLCTPAKCPLCLHPITEKTLVLPD